MAKKINEAILNINNNISNCQKSANPTTMRYHFTPVRNVKLHLLEWLSSKRQEIRGAGKDVEKKELWCTAGKNVRWSSHYGKHYGGSS